MKRANQLTICKVGVSETNDSVVKLYRLIHYRSRRTTGHSVTSHNSKRSSSLQIHKKRPAFYGRLSRNLKLYCCCHGAGCLPVSRRQSTDDSQCAKKHIRLAMPLRIGGFTTSIRYAANIASVNTLCMSRSYLRSEHCYRRATNHRHKKPAFYAGL